MKNPFEYDAANNLSKEEILMFYIPDYGYTRFLQSRRNIFLVGERGTGKTMALLYHSFPVQYYKAKKDKEPVSFEYIGVHIPCNTPLFHKKEYLLIEDAYKASVVCEHYLVLTILNQLIDTLSNIEEIIEEFNEFKIPLKREFSYILGLQLTDENTFLDAVRLIIRRELSQTQREVNKPDSTGFYANAFSFSSLLIPFIEIIRQTKSLKESHFMFMIDDAHDLNEYQTKALNSWIAYRDHSSYSFKVAVAQVGQPYPYFTASGGVILEGHDFTSISMDKPLLNSYSEFAKMARNIVQRRLDISGLKTSVDDFFPINPDFKKSLALAEEHTRKEAEAKFGPSATKQINDHIYKYARVAYFRQRADKANRPPYSGFDLIVNLSTGVIRNLLDPCYWMYDYEFSESTSSLVKQISPATQNRIIVTRSENKWKSIRELYRFIDGCSEEEAKQIYQFFDNLMILFRARLLNHKSEPRAITFTVSEKTKAEFDQVRNLLLIAQKAQLLYERNGNAKEEGKRDTYYVPNRMLLPARGLDPVGQHAHVQLKATDIWAAATRNAKFPDVNQFDNDGRQVTLSFDKDE